MPSSAETYCCTTYPFPCPPTRAPRRPFAWSPTDLRSVPCCPSPITTTQTPPSSLPELARETQTITVDSTSSHVFPLLAPPPVADLVVAILTLHLIFCCCRAFHVPCVPPARFFACDRCWHPCAWINRPLPAIRVSSGLIKSGLGPSSPHPSNLPSTSFVLHLSHYCPFSS